MPYMLNQYSPYPSPQVNYPTGDYRSISRLDRGKAELARTSQLEAEIARKRAWEDAIFQKKLEELQKSLLSEGAVGGSTQYAPQSRMGAMGRGGEMGGGAGSMSRWEQMNPEMAKYYRLLRGARQMSGAGAGNPLALGYNFGTLATLGGLPASGYFGQPAPVPPQPSAAQFVAAEGGIGGQQAGPQQAGRSPGWATYQRPEVPQWMQDMWNSPQWGR